MRGEFAPFALLSVGPGWRALRLIAILDGVPIYSELESVFETAHAAALYCQSLAETAL